ncbi:hypothetical protein AB0I28_04900 [Phytomonospora sp. NPDC050363]|uniref:hypothetical protein n=1 Tax=Phytomonospora sp. NPDC050363 TaxID=3155642 RepID=UPI0033C423F3
MRVRPEVVSAMALSMALALIVLPAAEALDDSRAAADPVTFADPAPGRIAFSSTDDYFQYLAATDDEGAEAPVLPQDVSPPASSEEGDARAGLVAWVADEDGRAILLSDGTTVTTVVPAVEGVLNYDPVISPDGSRIAFASRDYRGEDPTIHVWTVNADGTGLARIAPNDSEPAESPSWSPDGENLAFARWTATANYDIWRQHLPSGSRTRLTSTVNSDSDPAWSHDGLRIAFTASGRFEDEDGYGTTEIVSIPAGGGDVRREVYPFWPRASTEAVWTGPDSGPSSGIAFTSSSVDGNTLGVYARFGEGYVAEVSDRDDYTEQHPFWSAELGKIGYTAGRPLATSLLHTIQTDGNGQQPFSDRWDDRESAPVYSPDGTRLAFSRASGGETADSADIVIADLAAGTETLIPGPRPGFREFYVDPAWSPDGRFIAYGHEFTEFGDEENPTPVSAITVVELATGIRNELPVETSANEYSYSFDAEPSWDPVGSRLVFARAWVPRGSGGDDPGGPIFRMRAAFPDEDADLYLTPFPFPAGVRAVQLTNDLDEECYYDCDDRGPAWSPADPSKIAFSRDFDTLNLVDPATGTITAIPVDDDSVGGVADPAWSPQATRLAFSGYQSEGPSSIFTMEAAGGEPVHLTSTPYYVGEPTWQPTADLMVTATADLGTIEYGMQDTIRVTVTNLGSMPTAPTVKLTIPPGLAVASITPDSGFCDPVALVCTRDPLSAQVPWSIVIVVTGVAAGTHPVTADVTGSAFDPNLQNNSAITRVTVGLPPNLALTATVAPAVGYVGGEKLVVTFTIQNSPEAFARQVTLDASFPVSLPPPVAADPAACLITNPCPIGDIEPGGSRVVTFTIDPVTVVDEDAVGVVNSFVTDTDPLNNVASARIKVIQPIITSNPGLSAPGKVIQVHGENFPPGATVGFLWSEGISAGEEIVADAEGKFDTPMLIFHRDRPAARTIDARHLGGPLFGPVETPFLVVPGDQGPPDFIGRR